MRKTISLMQGWLFTDCNGETQSLDLPHTWNNLDGQDGGNDYKRCTCSYEKTFSKPELSEKEELWIEFKGVNASATVLFNDEKIAMHDGGYSTFRADLTPFLRDENTIRVFVDNSVNDRVYPQKADFTFYGGIYRDVNLLIVNRVHFSLMDFGGPGIKISPVVLPDGSAEITVEAPADGEVQVTLRDAEGNCVSSLFGSTTLHKLAHPHLWDGSKDPYLYTAEATLSINGIVKDTISSRFGIRSFRVDAKEGFTLNGRKYPLHGVSRHQDRRDLGNAISRDMHDEDMAIIREMGCNAIRLAHYQHDDHFYDLCDEYGIVVWAEIPYISEHLPNGRENTISQMKELITQCYNHPSIVCWGVSNEITISTKDRKDMLDNHHILNDLCHEMDPLRFTTLACYAMCMPVDPVGHITDAVGWNLYLGWYTPGLWLNDLWIRTFHKLYPNRPLCFSEYGAEGMPNLHNTDPKRNDHTEEYQCIYHEHMLGTFERHPWMWANYVWNMFDFAADARNQGGEPGMNHKGLVTFDRKLKKDSFYLYKAHWSEEPFVHICGRRYEERTHREAHHIKIYSNQGKVALYQNGQLVEEKEGSHIFHFKIELGPEPCTLKAVSGDCVDEIHLVLVDRENLAYRLEKAKQRVKSNWV